MKTISVTQARRDLSDIFGVVSYQKERIVLTNHNKQVALVPIEDLEFIQALEDEEDIREAELALKEIAEGAPTYSWEEVKKELKL